jgi:hypothetical protein
MEKGGGVPPGLTMKPAQQITVVLTYSQINQ